MKTLARLYDRLTISERGPAFLAAVARGDDVEQRRLIAASPKRLRNVSDLTGWTFAVSLVAADYRERQLGLLSMFWFARAQGNYAEALGTADAELLQREFRDFDADDRLDCETCDFIADVSAYRFCVNEAAWKMVCDELRIGPDALPAGDWLLEEARDRMPSDASSADELWARHGERFKELRSMLGRDDGQPFQPVTPRSVADHWLTDVRELAF